MFGLTVTVALAARRAGDVRTCHAGSKRQPTPLSRARPRRSSADGPRAYVSAPPRHGRRHDVTFPLTPSRRTLDTIRQNLRWAFGYNTAAIPIAMRHHGALVSQRRVELAAAIDKQSRPG
jgi:hypothetical protein